MSAFFTTQIAAQANAATGSALKKYTLAEGRFSISLPGEPEFASETEGGVTTLRYSAAGRGYFEVVEVSADNVDLGSLGDDSVAIVDDFFKGFILGLKEEGLTDDDIAVGDIELITQNNLKGRQLTIEYEGGKAVLRGLIHKQYIYLFASIPDVAEDDITAEIFGSFKINESSAK